MSNLMFDKEKREKVVAFMRRLNPDIDPRAMRLMDELRLTARAIYHVGESSVGDTGLSYAKYRLLMGLLFSEEIDGCREMNPSEISERQGTGRNTISALIRNLEAEGLVERSLNQQDRRKFDIRLTPAGRARVQEHLRNHLRIVGECFSALSAEEQVELSNLLGKIRVSVGAGDVQQKTATGA